MTRFYVGRLWTRMPRQTLDSLAREWFEDENHDLYTWASEMAGNRWDLQIEQGDYEYDTGACSYDVYLVYDNDTDAVHHRLRWA